MPTIIRSRNAAIQHIPRAKPVPKQERAITSYHRNPSLTPEQQTYIRENYITMKVEKIALDLGITVNAVYYYASAIGLKRGRRIGVVSGR